MKKRNRHAKLASGPLIFFLLLCIVSATIGIRINSHIYSRELRNFGGTSLRSDAREQRSYWFVTA